MKKIHIYLLLYVLCISHIFAQSREQFAEVSICSAQQEAFKNQLDLIADGADYLNIWIVPPLGCPRCEGLVNISLGMLRDSTGKEKSISWMLKYTSEQLKKYLEERKYPSDIILDVQDADLREIFSVNIGQFQTPHFIRYSVKERIFTAQASSLGMHLSKEWVQQQKLSRGNQIHMISCDKKVAENISNINPDLFTQEIKFDITGDLIQIAEMDLSSDRSEICLIDQFGWDIVRLNRDRKIVRTSILSQIPIDTFVSKEVPAETVHMLKKTGIINNMIFCPKYIGNSKDLMFSASLAYLDIQGDEVGYSNEAVMIRWDQNKNAKILCRLNTDHLGKISLAHTRYFPAPDGKYIYVKSAKGWPVSGTESSVDSGSAESPFRLDFYDEVPLFTVMNAAGEKHAFAGKLENVFRDIRTGYYFNQTNGVFYQDTFYYTSGYTGEIYSEYNLQKPIFKIPDFHYILSPKYSGNIELADGSKLPVLHTTDAPILELEPDSQLNYFMQYRKLFSRSMSDFALNTKYVSVLIQDQNNLIWRVYDRNSKELLRQEIIPAYYKDCRLSQCMLTRDDQDVLWLDAVYGDVSALYWVSTPAGLK